MWIAYSLLKKLNSSSREYFKEANWISDLTCAQLCPTLCNPMDCSLPAFSVHGILQARILEWVAMPPPGDLLNPGIELMSLIYIVLSLCESCIFQEISLFYLTYEIDWCKIISNSHITFYFSFNPIVYWVISPLSFLVLRVVSLLYFVNRVLFFKIIIFKLTFLTVSSISSV